MYPAPARAFFAAARTSDCRRTTRKPVILSSIALAQSSILRFIEDNWQLGRLGDGSFDALAGSLRHLFDFDRSRPAPRLILDPAAGRPAS